MLSRLFRSGRFFNRLLVGFDPVGMEEAGFVDPLVSVRAEEIALRLQEICWQSRLAITIKVSERRGKRGNGDAMFNGSRDRDAPIALRFQSAKAPFPACKRRFSMRKARRVLHRQGALDCL